jgi:histone acetyltransferase (RNA polymerase elongator complex component)
MQRLKHYTIPVFMPEMACPFQCVFCNQQKISGHSQSPDFKEVINTIRTYLASFKAGDRYVEVGFFGGTFTGIPLDIQENYLKTVQPFLDTGEVQGIRLSTRPDYIDGEGLKRLKKYRVSTIELGAQSLDDTVLLSSRRGHTVQQVEEAAALIHAAGFDLGLQMMIGLPGDTLEKAMATAQKIIDLGASNTRIYPALVIKDTALHRWYQQGKYKPLSLEEAVAWSKQLLLKFEDSGVRVIRLGLHPSEGLLDGSELVAGPFHPSFRELVLTKIWHDLLVPMLRKNNMAQADAIARNSREIEIKVPSKEINYAVGYGGKNKKMLLEHFREVKFTPDPHLSARNFKVKDKV